jgi:histidinol-phosphate aminotransferase
MGNDEFPTEHDFLGRQVLADLQPAFGAPSPIGWIRLNTNESAVPPSPRVIEAVVQSALSLNRYPDPLGEPFRTEIALRHDVSPDEILVSHGADGILTSCFHSFCDPGSRVAFLDPTYPFLYNLAALHSARLMLARDPETLLRLAHDSDAAMTILVNPNSPSGSWLPVAELAKYLPIPGILIVDEAYVSFAPGDALELRRSFDNIVVVRSFSKGYGLAGVRLGYAVAGRHIVEALKIGQDPYPVSSCAVAAGIAALADNSYYEHYRALILDERARVTGALREVGWEVEDSHANFVFATRGDSAVGAYVDLLADHHILVRRFPRAPKGLRISIGSPEENDRLIQVLSEAGELG